MAPEIVIDKFGRLRWAAYEVGEEGERRRIAMIASSEDRDAVEDAAEEYRRQREEATEGTEGEIEETADGELEFHEYASVFPLMDGEEFAALRRDIEENGLIEPIVVYEGKIVDGRNRYRACMEAEVEYEVREWEGEPEELLDWVVSKNMHRRHLTTTQRAMIAAKLANMRQGERSDLAQNCARLTSQSKAADQMHVSRRSVQHAKKVLEGGCEALQAYVEKGYVSVSAAQRLIEALDPSDQEQICNRGVAAVVKALERLKAEAESHKAIEGTEGTNEETEETADSAEGADGIGGETEETDPDAEAEARARADAMEDMREEGWVGDTEETGEATEGTEEEVGGGLCQVCGGPGVLDHVDGATCERCGRQVCDNCVVECDGCRKQVCSLCWPDDVSVCPECGYDYMAEESETGEATEGAEGTEEGPDPARCTHCWHAQWATEEADGSIEISQICCRCEAERTVPGEYDAGASVHGPFCPLADKVHAIPTESE